MTAQQTYVLGGKEFNVWTETQLCALNREALKKRCLDLRDHVGPDSLPPLPRQPDGMLAWILEVQNMVMGIRQRAAYQADEEYDRVPEHAPDPYDRGRPSDVPHDYYAQEASPYGQVPPSHDLFGGRAPPSRGYDQAPASVRDYAPSNAGSVAESRAGALGSKMLILDGKECSVWTQGQLSAMNRTSLQKRCMDFRDLIGRDQLPPMPRHPEAMVEWLLHAQAMVMNGVDNSAASYGYDMAENARGPSRGFARGPPGGMPRGGPSGHSRDYEPSEAPSEAQSNYETNMRDAQAIRQKNQGSRGIF